MTVQVDPVTTPPEEEARIVDPVERMAVVHIENERSLLGSLFLNGDRFDEVAELVTNGDFLKPIHATIWRGMKTLHALGDPIDVVLVKAEAVKMNGTPPTEIAHILARLVSGQMRNANLVVYAERVAKDARQRDRLIQVDALRRAVVDDSPTAEDMIEGLVASDDDAKERFKPNLLDLAVLDTEVAPRVEWIFQPWLALGDSLLIGDDSGTGKSLLALDLALALTTGGTFLGMPVGGGPFPVAFLDEENSEPIAGGDSNT